MVATALDTNVIVTLLKADAAADVRRAQCALEEASTLGKATFPKLTVVALPTR